MKMLKVNMPKAYEIEFLDVPVPEADKDEVLIEMKRIGVCGSDIQVYHGKHKYMKFPIVQGHEGSGIIAKVGKNVEGLKVGDCVTVQPQIFCGECQPCKTGHYNVCENLKVFGIHVTGMASEYFLVDASKVIKLPDGMSFDEGAMVEPTAVATGTIKRCGDVIGKNIVVLGAGPIGNLVAQVAKASGAGKVMITDINQKRLDIAAKCNIEYCVNTMDKDLGDAIAEYFGAAGADVIIDCAAVKASINQAINNSRCSSKIVIVGNFKEPVEIEMPRLQRREVDMISVMMYVREDYEKAIQLIAEGKVKVTELISKYFDIRQFKEVYDYIDNNVSDVMKVMIKVGQ
jgi:L-iditol 2-dehydrogenase